MWNSFVELAALSMGVIPVLVVLFTVALAVIIERLYFLPARAPIAPRSGANKSVS